MGQKINLMVFVLGSFVIGLQSGTLTRTLLITLTKTFESVSILKSNLQDASVSTVEIERAANRVNVSIHTAKPGMVIGKGGSEVEALRKELNKLTGKRVHINIVEIKKPDLDAHLVGESIARQLEARIAFRRAMRGAMQRAMRAGAKGIKTQVAGRLNGADMSRIEWHTQMVLFHCIHSVLISIILGTKLTLHTVFLV